MKSDQERIETASIIFARMQATAVEWAKKLRGHDAAREYQVIAEAAERGRLLLHEQHEGNRSKHPAKNV